MLILLSRYPWSPFTSAYYNRGCRANDTGSAKTRFGDNRRVYASSTKNLYGIYLVVPRIFSSPKIYMEIFSSPKIYMEIFSSTKNLYGIFSSTKNI